MDASIAEFVKIDPGDDGFRYPFERNTTRPSLPTAPALVNLAMLHDTMEANAMFLSCVRQEMVVRLDGLRDVET